MDKYNFCEIEMVFQDLSTIEMIHSASTKRWALVCGLNPYTSLFVVESHKCLNKNGISVDITSDTDIVYLIKKARNSVKASNLQRIIDIELYHKQYWLSNLKPPWRLLKKMLYTDLGIYFYGTHPILNTILINWFFDLPLIFTKYSHDDAYKYGQAIGKYIGILRYLGDSLLSVKENQSNINIIEENKFKSYDTKIKKFYNNIFISFSMENKRLFFNLLCIVNFVTFPFDDILPGYFHWKLRVKYICLYHIYYTIKNIHDANYASLSYKEKICLESILCDKSLKKILKKNLRNFLVHYCFPDNYPLDTIDIMLPFGGAIEYYTKMHAEKLYEEVSQQLLRISDILENSFGSWQTKKGRFCEVK